MLGFIFFPYCVILHPVSCQRSTICATTRVVSCSSAYICLLIIPVAFHNKDDDHSNKSQHEECEDLVLKQKLVCHKL